jgi:hypothetical protein
LALALARQGCLVFYVQWNAYDRDSPFVSLDERCYLAHVPVRTFEDLSTAYIYILTWNYKQLRHFRHPKIIYDFVDELDAFEGSQAELSKAHDRLLGEAKLVLATSERLHRQVALTRPDALLCPNGVDYEHFSKAQSLDRQRPPEDMQPIISMGKPVIGYHGALARWMDYRLLQTLASQRQDLSFVLIGPDFDHTLPRELLSLSNVFWLGVKSYEILSDYLQFIDVGIIPFQVNNITHATSPLKLFEYMAAGKPVVITPMEESMRYPGVLVADGLEAFSRQLDRALSLRKDTDFMSLLDSIARQNTWEKRARQILDSMG